MDYSNTLAVAISSSVSRFGSHGEASASSSMNAHVQVKDRVHYAVRQAVGAADTQNRGEGEEGKTERTQFGHPSAREALGNRLDGHPVL